MISHRYTLSARTQSVLHLVNVDIETPTGEDVLMLLLISTQTYLLIWHAHKAVALELKTSTLELSNFMEYDDFALCL